MIRQKVFAYRLTLLVMLLAACGQVPTPAATPVPSSTATAIPSPTQRPTETPPPTTTKTPRDAKLFQRVTSLPDQPSELYSNIDLQVRAPADGSVWVITPLAVGRWDGQTWDPIHVLEEDMLADVDESGRLWMRRQEAEEISAWQNGQWTTYGAESGWTSAHINPPWNISTGKDGTVWLPTVEDVRYFDGKRWRIYTWQEIGFPLPEEDYWIVRQITMPNDSEQVWVGQCHISGPGPVGGSGVRWFTGQSWQGANAPVEQDCISAIHADPAGNMWIGMRDVVWRYEPGSQKWTSFPVPDTRELEYYSSTYPVELMANGTGDAWARLQYCGGASCDTGHFRLYHIHDGEWTQVFDIKGSADFLAREMALDGKGQAWLFWDGVVYQLSGATAEPVTMLPAIGVDASPDGNLWVLTQNDGALWMLEP